MKIVEPPVIAPNQAAMLRVAIEVQQLVDKAMMGERVASTAKQQAFEFFVQYGPALTALLRAPDSREQIAEGKAQWDEVAKILGADGDCVDSVINRAKLLVWEMSLLQKETQFLRSHRPIARELDLAKETIKELHDDAHNWGEALNEAAWVFTNVCPEKSALLFNTCKTALRAAILKYHEVVLAQVVKKEKENG